MDGHKSAQLRSSRKQLARHPSTNFNYGECSMTIEYIRYRIPDKKQSTFLSDYSKAVKALENSAYCLGYELSQCEEESDRFILRIEWTSTDDHLKKFRSSDEFKAFLPHVRPYIDDIEEMQHYRASDLRFSRE